MVESFTASRTHYWHYWNYCASTNPRVLLRDHCAGGSCVGRLPHRSVEQWRVLLWCQSNLGTTRDQTVFLRGDLGMARDQTAMILMYRTPQLSSAGQPFMLDLQQRHSIARVVRSQKPDVWAKGQSISNSYITPLFFKMAQNLDLRCVLVPAPWVLGPKHVSNPE